MKRRYAQGAELDPSGGVHFRVWAPNARAVALLIEGDTSPIAMRADDADADANGYFAVTVKGARAGTRYRYKVDGEGPFPDPASRFQPEGVHGPSEVVDPRAFAWTDRAWPGLRIEGQIFYELHVGTFTREGTWASAANELEALVDLGVTCIEMMPVNEFAGAFGWGYDGVDLYAPTRAYGTPDDLRRFVDRAHALGLGVILDVVYNHLGPSGNFLPRFGPYFAKKPTEWGESINYDGDGSHGVRAFFVDNAAYWVDELHFDGLRIDATQCIWDSSKEHVIGAIVRRARAAAGKRSIVIVGENEPQDMAMVTAHGLDALWNDDFHHTASVAATGRAEAYYCDYGGSPQEIISAAKRGFLYQGQRYEWQKQRRGQPALDAPPSAYVGYLQNHDQVSNAAAGERLHMLTSPGRWRVLTALLFLLPHAPLLFQGQEFAASAAFTFFADHDPELAKLVRKGRAEFVAQFQSVAADDQARARIPAPDARATFERCVIDHDERQKHAAAYALHKDLIALRKKDGVIGRQERGAIDGAVLGERALLLRYFGGERGDRLIVANLGADLRLSIVPEPLLAPPASSRWRRIFATESVAYGGAGVRAVEDPDGRWFLPAESLVVLASVSASEASQ